MKPLLLILFILGVQNSFSQNIDCDYPIYDTSYMPTFKGGVEKLGIFIQKHLKYPKLAYDSNIQGTVKVKFKIKANTKVDSVRIEKGLGYGCDEEAIRLIKLTNKKWKPASIEGKKLSTSVIYNIKFSLPDD